MIGVWPLIAAKAQPIHQIKASDGLAGQGPAPFFLTFDAAEIEEGPMGFLVEDRYLYAAFLAAIEASPNVTLLSSETVTGQEVLPQWRVGHAGIGSGLDRSGAGWLRRSGQWHGNAGRNCADRLGLWPDRPCHRDPA